MGWANFKFGDPQRAPPPKREKICLGPICTITQNFTPLGDTVAERSVTRQKNKKTANLVSCHINVQQVATTMRGRSNLAKCTIDGHPVKCCKQSPVISVINKLQHKNFDQDIKITFKKHKQQQQTWIYETWQMSVTRSETPNSSIQWLALQINNTLYC